MKAYQLDENLNDKRLADGCNSEGKCTVRRYPGRLRGEKDPVMLPELLSKDAPLLTRDFPIVHEHKNYIPKLHSGVIVVRTKNTNRAFTTKIAMKNIETLKERFPPWAETNWTGVYLEIDEEGIYVGDLHDLYSSGRSIRFDTAKFESEMREAIRALSEQLGVNPQIDR